MTKDDILAEIRRTAKAGKPLGRARFQQETGIKRSDWLGKYWATWGDACLEAGLEPNRRAMRTPDADVLPHLADLIRRLEEFPSEPALKLQSNIDSRFPKIHAFRRYGSRADLARAVLAYVETREDMGLIADLCRKVAEGSSAIDLETLPSQDIGLGFVYLIRSGRFYKIGRSNSVGRRFREVTLQLPERAELIHSINTDDPAGIERYWHERFADYRRNGEWFRLGPEHVAIFRRRKFM